jgi:hypothetical protein
MRRLRFSRWDWTSSSGPWCHKREGSCYARAFMFLRLLRLSNELIQHQKFLIVLGASGWWNDTELTVSSLAEVPPA